MAYMTDLAAQVGIPLFALTLLIIWSAIWKLIALWKSARNNHIVWFIVLAIFNTAGILPILYIFFFSKTKLKNVKKVKKKKIVKKNNLS